MRVAVFITCLVDNFYPEVAEAMVQLLQDLGVDVEVPEAQTCCGQPAFNSGFVQEASASARTLLEAFRDFDYVVSPSGSCTGMVHHYYEAIFKENSDELQAAKELATKTYEFTQFLVNVLGVTNLEAAFPYRVTYHPSCHGSRILGVQDEPLLLLGNVAQLQLIDLPYAQDCCGFGGTFAVKMGDISTAMVTEKTHHVVETNAQVLVGLDMGCLMNIGGRLRREGHEVRVLHLAQLLAEGRHIAGSKKLPQVVVPGPTEQTVARSVR